MRTSQADGILILEEHKNTILSGKLGSMTWNDKISDVKIAAMERNKKLNELEYCTEKMSNRTNQYATNIKLLLNKEKNKKWYQC